MSVRAGVTLMMTLEQYIEFKTYGFTMRFDGCSVRKAGNRTAFTFSTAMHNKYNSDLEGEPEGELRGCIRYDDCDGGGWTAEALGSHGLALSSCLFPLSQTIMIERFDPKNKPSVLTNGGGAESAADTFVKKPNPFRGEVKRVRCIDGWLYMCTSGHGFGKRLGNGTWKSFGTASSKAFPGLPQSSGFNDFDGFSEQDIYCGGAGELWHFNGTEWRRLDLPAGDFHIRKLCCDRTSGKVVVSGDNGETWFWSDTWERVEGRSRDGYFNDLLPFQGEIWCSHDSGLWVISKGVLRKADVPQWVHSVSGYVAAEEDVLLAAGSGGAGYYDQEGWHQLILTDNMEKRYQANPYRYISKKDFRKRALEMFGSPFGKDNVDVLDIWRGAYLYENYTLCMLVEGNLHIQGDLYMDDAWDQGKKPKRDTRQQWKGILQKNSSGDWVLPCDLMLDCIAAGLMVTGDLTIDGQVANTNGDWGLLLYVGGTLRAARMDAGGAHMFLNSVVLKNDLRSFDNRGSAYINHLKCKSYEDRDDHMTAIKKREIKEIKEIIE